MNLSRAWFAGILLGPVAVWAACDSVWAQAWQEQPADYGAPRAEWQQRVLKQPQQPQWHAAGQPADSSEQAARLTQATDQYQQAASPRRTTGPYRTARRSTNDGDVFDTGAVPKEPAASGRQRAPAAGGAEVIPRGQLQFEPVASEGAFAGPGGSANCGEPGEACGDCGGCDSCCGPPCDDCCDFGWEVFDGRCGPFLRGVSVFMGADGFKSDGVTGLPDKNGTFGVNEGLNVARPLGDPWGCGYQIGANFVQSDFAGNTPTDGSTPFAPYRRQYFVTAGIFRRADPGCGGFQGGVAYDYLHDVYNPYGTYTQANLQQLRSETGYVFDDCWEVGYYGAYGVTTDQKTIDATQLLKLNPTDMFLVYLRRNFDNGGDGRIWGGVTGNGDGLLGVDLWVPLGRQFCLGEPGQLHDSQGTFGHHRQPRESWGLVAQIVWYPGLNAKCQQRNPYRPIFNVADNSLFMVDRLLQTSP